MDLLITCPPGLAQICKTELKHLGYPSTVTSNTSLIVPDTTAKDMITLNLRSRTANKIYLILDSRQINTFDELFDFVQQQDRENRIQTQQPILVEASSYKSQLTSLPSIQSIVKKAITLQLTGDREVMRVENKGIEEFGISLMLQENRALILLNTSGRSLHRRGYRSDTGEAPIKENIAAGLLLSSGRRFGRPLYDICCGSGTVCIEAAMIAKNIAPGLLRSFAFQSRKGYKSAIFEEIKTEAIAKRIHKSHRIFGSDIDPEIIEKAKRNARHVGLDEDSIDFQVKDCMDISFANNKEPSTLISNPPYGQRMQQSDIRDIHKHLFSILESSETNFSGGVFTGYTTLHPTQPILRTQHKLKNGADDVVFWKRKN